jgi:hypothetical protein
MLKRVLMTTAASIQVLALATVVVVLVVGVGADATTLVPGFEPLRLTGVAGGTVRATRFGNTDEGFCTGWIDATPNHEFTLEQAFDTLTLEVSAPSDTTLIVLGPTGTRCNDDATDDNPNPQLRGAWAAGQYRVYVGSYEEGQRIRYTLTVR